LGVIARMGARPKNVALGYDVRKISAGCLVFFHWSCQLWDTGARALFEFQQEIFSAHFGATQNLRSMIANSILFHIQIQ